MEKIKLGKLLLSYLKARRKVILMFLVYEIIFIVVCSLYHMDNLPKVLYAGGISLFISICYGILDFRKYIKHVIKIYEAYINIEDLTQLLPDVEDLQEEGYQAIAKKLFDERRNLISTSDLRRRETTDYYTLWVHQIKTPIAAMKLLLQNEEKHSNAYALLEELFKIEQYVEMVLHYLRLESMASDMVIEEYELKNIVNQAIKKHSILFINSKLSFTMGDINCSVLTDEKWLSFVIEQLISNAIKYTLRGGISIYSERRFGKDCLIIEDTGIGIKSEDLPRIFDRGFTGYNGRLDKKSTGIGLYLCKQILDKLAHKIEVTSTVGKGTRVCIEFPDRDF